MLAVRRERRAGRAPAEPPAEAMLFEVFHALPESVSRGTQQRVPALIGACGRDTPWAEWLLNGPWADVQATSQLAALGVRLDMLVQRGLTWERVAETKRDVDWWRRAFHASMDDFWRIPGDIRATGWCKEQVEQAFSVQLT